MNIFVSHIYKESPGKSLAPSEEIQESIYPYHEEMNTSEGGEFLDDAIRMKDQPPGYTEANEDK